MAQHCGREDLKHPNFFHSLLERVTAEKQEVLKPESKAASDDACSTSGGESDLASGLEASESDEESSKSDQ